MERVMLNYKQYSLNQVKVYSPKLRNQPVRKFSVTQEGNSAKIFDFQMHDNDEVSKRSKISEKLTKNSNLKKIAYQRLIWWTLIASNGIEYERSVFSLWTYHLSQHNSHDSMHYLIGQFAVHTYVSSVFKIFCFPFLCCKEYSKRIVTIQRQQIKSQKAFIDSKAAP